MAKERVLSLKVKKGSVRMSQYLKAKLFDDLRAGKIEGLAIVPAGYTDAKEKGQWAKELKRDWKTLKKHIRYIEIPNTRLVRLYSVDLQNWKQVE